MNKIRCYHSPAAYAFRDRDLTLQLVVPDEESALVDITLCFRTEGEGENKNGSLRMLPVDGLMGDESHSVYAATVGAAELAEADRLCYHFLRDGVERMEYTVPLTDAPAMPPFMVSELFPWGGGPVQCMELYNPGTETVDLYDYELVIPGVDGTIEKRDPLADGPGINLLEPHSMGVLNFISSGVRKELEARAEEENPIFNYLAAQYPETCSDIAERDVKWMSVDLSFKDEKEEWHTKEGCFGIYHWLKPRQYRVVPRGGELDSAVYILDVNMTKEELQVRKFRSSRWTVDPRNPAVALCTVKYDLPTPGWADPYQFLPDGTDVTVPAILPVEPEGRIHLANGDCKVRFAVAGKAVALPVVFVKAGEGFKRYPAVLSNDGLFEATVPAAVMMRIAGRFEYYIEVSGGLYTASYGSAADPRSVRIVDNAGPAILRSYPAQGQALVRIRQPKITLEYYDISSVNTQTSILCVDGRNVSTAARWEAGRVTYTPETPMAYGEHTFEVSLRDLLGNRTYRKISFSVCDGKEMNFYRGEVHCHTLESDGLGSPADAITYARDTGKVDYFAVTDHSHYINLEELRKQREVADTFNKNGEFATMHGFEMTWNNGTGYWGHMNVLNTDWITQYHENVPLYEFYEMIKKDPDAIGMFNHPDDTWGEFDEFEGWDPEIDQKMCLAEIRGGSFDRNYVLMLSKGWHAAPVANEDNHGWNWTTATPSTGYVLAPSLTRENVIDAFRARRTYTTYDNTMKILYRVNGEWMGSRLQAPEKLTAEIEIHTESENGIGQLSLVTEDNIVVARINAGPLKDFSWQVELDPDFDYYYLRVNNGSLYSATAPVFIEGRDLLNITDLSYGICAEDPAMPHVIEATVKNDSDKQMRDVTVDYYLTPLGGFELRTLVPFASVHLGKLEAGESHTVARRVPAIATNRRVTVVVNGWQGKSRFADTTYRLITPLLISKMVPLTTALTVGETEIANPFPYVELYNPTPSEVDLKKYVIRLRHGTGVQPLPERTLALDGYKIPAGKTLVIWVRPAECELTAEDFNAHYGTALVEGENLLITANRIISGSKAGGRRVELLCNKEMITRVGFGLYCRTESDVVEDTPLCYGDQRRMSWLQTKLEYAEGESILPGEVLPAQVPAAKKGELSRDEVKEAEKAETRNKVMTKLTKAPLVPLQAAKLIAGAVATLKDLFSTKE
ncbi:MAG: CehA/McbA family metallohydrolase [Clostridia bacterium]|nr:CehA/McbA family metallohydrolase [Clostridia bacterium]